VEDVFQSGSADIRYTIPANSLRAGNIIRVRAMFTLDKGGSNTDIEIRGFVGPNGTGTAGDITMGIATVSTATDDTAICVDIDYIVRSIGSSGVCLPTGNYATNDSTAGTFTEYGFSQTINTTGALYVYFSGELSIAPSNILYMESFTVEII
jgi:hypothetical protein